MMKRIYLLFLAIMVSGIARGQLPGKKWYEMISWTYPTVDANVPVGRDRYIQASGQLYFRESGLVEYEMKYTQSGEYILPKVKLEVERIADSQPSKHAGLTGFEGSYSKTNTELVFHRDDKYPNIYKGSILIESFVPNMGTGKCNIRILTNLDGEDQKLERHNK